MALPTVQRPFVVIGHGEPLPLPRAAGFGWPRLTVREVAKILLRDPRATDVYSNYLRLRQLARHELPDLLVITSIGWRDFLVERRIPAHWVPMGYDVSYGHDMGLPRDLGVLFLGTSLDVPRRRRMIRRLRRAGVDVVTMGSWFDPAGWGDNRTRLLNRTRVLLNLTRHPGELPSQRLILGMANKALVISEPMYRPAPFVPGKHYVSATIEEMPDAIRHYLAHDRERDRIVDEAYQLVTQEVTEGRSNAQVLALIAERLDHSPAEGTSLRAVAQPSPQTARGGVA